MSFRVAYFRRHVEDRADQEVGQLSGLRWNAQHALQDFQQYWVGLGWWRDQGDWSGSGTAQHRHDRLALHVMYSRISWRSRYCSHCQRRDPQSWLFRCWWGHPFPEGICLCSWERVATNPHCMQQWCARGFGWGVEALFKGEMDKRWSIQGLWLSLLGRAGFEELARWRCWRARPASQRQKALCDWCHYRGGIEIYSGWHWSRELARKWTHCRWDLQGLQRSFHFVLCHGTLRWHWSILESPRPTCHSNGERTHDPHRPDCPSRFKLSPCQVLRIECVLFQNVCSRLHQKRDFVANYWSKWTLRDMVQWQYLIISKYEPYLQAFPRSTNFWGRMCTALKTNLEGHR